MTDQKTAVRTALTAYAPLIALVPATRIFAGWPTSFTTLPVIAYNEEANLTGDEDIFDNAPKSETSEMMIHIFNDPNKSTTAIAQEVDTALSGAGWNRDGSRDLVEADGKTHRVMMYSKRVFY
jgi:hypothetical protein